MCVNNQKMKSPIHEACVGCGWHYFCGEGHDHRRMRLAGCAELDKKYEYRFGDTEPGWKCPRGGIGGGGHFSIWRRERGQEAWRWVGYV
jgi:hypothetical protein